MSIASMTGFGAATAVVESEEISVELRSVNGKFCEVKTRLPRELAAAEGELVKLVKERIGRGNVDVAVRRSAPGGLGVEPKVNGQLLAALVRSLKTAAAEAGLGDRLELRDLLGISGIVTLEERAPDVASATKALLGALAPALDALVEVRRREGAALEHDLRTRLATMRQHVEAVAVLVPKSADAYRERLRTRVKELAQDVEADPARLELEVVLFADRADVAEELTRLAAHFTEFDRLLDRPGPVGRQLEFLLQEINREVNTTGSKSQAAEIARYVVELKTELERLREQVQNVE